jgi:DNA-binding HxlR family transcriptional regulator
VEYSLTDKGRALAPLIEDMRAYGYRWLNDDGGCEMPAAEAPAAEPVVAAA